MTNEYKIIKDAIVAKLNTLTKIKHVYPYEKGELEGYPAITIFSAEYIPSQLTTQHDVDLYIFTLHLYQEMKSDNVQADDAEQIVDDALVEIIQTFQADPQISDTCDNVTVSAQKGWVDREVLNRAGIVTLTVTKIMQTSV